jgi:hypothetical protein
MSSFPDPVELEEVDGRWSDPDVFDRITAVPGEVSAGATAAAPSAAPAEPETSEAEDPISGLHPRGATADADDDIPLVLARPKPSSKPSPKPTPKAIAKQTPKLTPKAVAKQTPKPGDPRKTTRPEGWRSTGTRKKTPVLELDLDDIEPLGREASLRPDALEMPIPSLPVRTSPAPAPVPSARPEVSPEVVDMRDRYATGDFTGALVVAEGLLEAEPAHEEARRVHERCTEALSHMYLARLGSPAQVVRVVLPNDQIRWLSLDHRAGFLLSLVDGTLSIEELLDISGMTRLDALRILYGLLDQRVIALCDRT